MATSISSIYDDVLTELATNFPSKTRMPNAYDPTMNPITYLRDAYGLRIDGATPTERDITVFSRFRNFSVIFTREIIKTDVQVSQVDTAVKAMLEDIYTVQKEFLGADQFGSATNVDIVNVGAFSGIELFDVEKSNFIISEIALSIQVSNLY